MKELKNLERTNFNWFGVKELKDKDSLDETQIKETLKFTFAPFIPYWIYSFLRTNWDFLLLRYLAIIVFYAAYMVFYFSILLGALRKSDIAEFPGQMLSKGLIYIGIAVVIFLLLLFVAEIYECTFARRLSWNRLSWKDFESYEYSERQWNIAGLVFLGIRVLCIILVVVMLIIMFKYLPGMQDFKDFLFHV